MRTETRKRVKSILGFILCCVAIFTSCKVQNNEQISLNSGWEYSLEENGNYVLLEDKYLSDLTNIMPETTGFVYLRKSFVIPLSLQNKDLSVYLGRITIADETYINGNLIGNKGFMPPNEWSAWNVARLYHIPSKILNINGENEIKVKIWIDGEGSIVSSPFIGTTEDATKAWDIEDFWNSKINLLVTMVMIIMSIYHIFLYLKRKKDIENLTFAITNIVTALYLSVFYIEQLPGFPIYGMSFLWFQKIFSAAIPFFIPLLITTFVNSFLRRKELKTIKILRILCVVIPVTLILITNSYATLRQMRDFVQIFLIPPLLYLMYILISSIVKKEKEVVPLLIGFSPLVVAVFADLFIHNILKLYNVPYISMFGWVLVIIVFLFILANRFSNARTEAEDLNENLEKKVIARTQELSESNAALKAAQDVAEKDMKLAVFVQQSFMPRKAPVTEDYDVAFLYKPMSGVSGDLYDFFAKENKMKGAALFDVSGHGISSGLVTMLAKFIISRQFETGYDKRLKDVMYQINESLCEEKGDVENYLTGILLRFNENVVEYVNAGHPSLIYRLNIGKVKEVKVDDNTDLSNLVGMKYLPVEYKTIKFSMNSGDAILMYTDCLQESRNVDGEEFSAERVAQAFSNATGETAQEKLDSLLKQFEDFTAGQPLKDDLSIIVIQKK